MDLSLSSLAYAIRNSEVLGLTNIEYMQGDILALEEDGPHFDHIECAGVLHHMRDPMAGWRKLTDITRSGGTQRIALYSELGRKGSSQTRTRLAEALKETPHTAEAIRQFRVDCMAKAAEGDPESREILTASDFFTLSECRDFLFHVQEHRFTILQIEEALSALGLRFLGFELDGVAMRAFRRRYPDKAALSDLALWHGFEVEHPETFKKMYQFWVQKRASMISR